MVPSLTITTILDRSEDTGGWGWEWWGDGVNSRCYYVPSGSLTPHKSEMTVLLPYTRGLEGLSGQRQPLKQTFLWPRHAFPKNLCVRGWGKDDPKTRHSLLLLLNRKCWTGLDSTAPKFGTQPTEIISRLLEDKAGTTASGQF